MNKPQPESEVKAKNGGREKNAGAESTKPGKKFRDRITPLQLYFLTFSFILSGAVLHNASYAAGENAFFSAFSAAFAAAFAAAFCGVLLSLVYYFAAKTRFSSAKSARSSSEAAPQSCSSDLTDWLCGSFGRAAGSFFSLLYLIFFVFRASRGIKAVGEYCGAFLLPSVSPLIISAVILILCALTVYAGLTAAGRFAEVSSVFAAFAVLLLLLGFLNISDCMAVSKVSGANLTASCKSVFSCALSSFTEIFCDTAAFLCVFGKVIPRASENASKYANAEAANNSEAANTDKTVINLKNEEESKETLSKETLSKTTLSKTTLSKTDKSKTGRRGVCFGTFPAAVISAAAVFLLVTLRDINIFGAGLLSKLDFPSSEAVGLLGGADLRPFFDFCIAILYAIRAAILLFAAFFTFHGLFSRKSKKSKSSGASSRARRIAVCISAVILIAAALVFCYFSEIPAESKASAEIPLSYSDALPTLRLAAVILLSVIIPLLMLLSGVFRKQNRKIRHIRGE